MAVSFVSVVDKRSIGDHINIIVCEINDGRFSIATPMIPSSFPLLHRIDEKRVGSAFWEIKTTLLPPPQARARARD